MWALPFQGTAVRRHCAVTFDSSEESVEVSAQGLRDPDSRHWPGPARTFRTVAAASHPQLVRTYPTDVFTAGAIADRHFFHCWPSFSCSAVPHSLGPMRCINTRLGKLGIRHPKGILGTLTFFHIKPTICSAGRGCNSRQLNFADGLYRGQVFC